MSANTVSQFSLLDEEPKRKQSSVILKFSGDITYESSNEVVEQVSEALVSQPTSVTMDFSEVEMVDSSGLRALLQGRKLCKDASVDFGLTGVSDYVSRVITMSGFSKLFGLFSADTGMQHSSADSDVMELPATGWKTNECVINSDPSLISVLREKVTEAASDAGATGEILCDIKIAVGEALTNAYRHGSPEKGTSRITLRYMTCSKAIVIEIQDEGTPFDPNSIAIPDPNLMRDNGMGIYLMRMAMDVVDFCSSCPGNRVRMVKWLNGYDGSEGRVAS